MEVDETGSDEALMIESASSSSVMFVEEGVDLNSSVSKKRKKIDDQVHEKNDSVEQVLRELASIDLHNSNAVECLASLQRRAASLLSDEQSKQIDHTQNESKKKRKRAPTTIKKLNVPNTQSKERKGEYSTKCIKCGKECGSIMSLSGHLRFCDESWRCDWCKCRGDETNGKNPGPNGAATLCSACGSRFRSGHKGPILANKNGKFECACGKELDSVAALGCHRRFCDGGKWRCQWCDCTASECAGKNPGPDGKATLCGTCGSRYRAGHTGPPKKKDGKFECDDCGKLLDTVGALGSHRRFCDGGKWRCKWCQCTANECIGKNPGPDGKATLCQTCGARYRSGHSGPPKRIDGKYLCELCGKLLDSLVALGGHKRFCPGGSAWRCDWCNQFTEFKNRSSGPLGDNKLCISCHDDWKRFHFDAPPLIITSGQFICELCGAHLLDIASLILHRTNQCDQTLKSKLYEDSAEWLGSSRAAILGPAAKNNALPQNAIGGIGKPRDDTSKYKSENDVTWPTNMKRLRPITNGLSLGERALEFWDTARHLARRLDGGPLHGLVPEDFLRQRGQWWLKLTPGMLAYNDGWDWIAYERGLTSVNGVSPAFHGLNAVLTRALLRYRGDGVWQSVTAHNWLTLLCNTFSNDPLADFVRTAQARVKENREKARNNTTQPNGTSPSFTKSAPSSTELTSVLKPAERLEFISHFGNLLMSHAIMYQHVDYSTSLLVKLAALKREAWQHRQRAARHTETCLNRPEPLIAEIQNGNARINKRIRVRLGPAPPLFNTIDNNDEHIEAARTRRLEEQLAAHRLELDCQFAGLRALAPSYRRRPLGIDRRGRAYFLLGDVWEALFVRCPCVKADNKKKAPPPGRDLWGDTVTTVDESEIRARQPAANWFMLEPSQAAALRESLCPEQEAQLAAALDEILPGLLATQGMSDPTYILSGGAPAQDKENIQCAVCGEATSNHDDKGTLDDVLLCDHCDAEVHFACSGLQKMPKDDEPFQCPACAASSTDYLPLLSNRVETDDDCPPTTP